jgi:hypothetical protein
MKPNKFDIFYWWGILFSSIPLMIIFIGFGVLSAFLPKNTSVEKIVVTEVINIEQEPKSETNTKVGEVLPIKKVIPKVTVQDTGHHTGHHTVQDTAKKSVSTVTDTTKKL